MRSYSTAHGWVCASVCLTVGSCVSVLDGHKCSVLFFQLSYNSLSSGCGFCEACLIPAETSSHPALGWWGASGFFSFFLFLPWWNREESPIFKSSQFISCSSLHLHVSQPCYNSFFALAAATELFHRSWRLSHSNCSAQLTPCRAV